MKVLLLLAAPVLSLLLLAAHFWRATSWIPAAICLVFAALPLLRRAWVPRTLQVVLVVGAVEWGLTAYGFVLDRIVLGRPWGRLALILGAVALLTAASALVFNHPRLRARYRGD